jgi:hypothetical protein
MQGRGEDDDRTDILDGGAETVPRADPGNAITEIQCDAPASDATAVLPGALRRKPRRVVPWIVFSSLSIAVAVPLAYYIYSRTPPTTDIAQPQADTYSQALHLAESALLQGEVATLPAQLLGQLRRQPADAKLRALLEDAVNYRDMHYLLEMNRVLDVVETRRSLPFHTPLFIQAGRTSIDAALGSSETIDRLVDAGRAWRSGELVVAIDTVKQLASQSGNLQAEAMLSHYTKVVKDYEVVATLQGDPGYPQALLAFYLSLDPRRDRFFWQRLEQDFRLAGDAVAPDIAQQLQRAASLWGSYHDSGGFNEATLLFGATNDGFRVRAGELTEASNLLDAAAGLLQGAQAEGNQTSLFPALIQEEIREQRERLELLGRFNDDAVIHSRLLLLPSIGAVGQR